LSGLVLARAINLASGALALGIPAVLAIAILPALRGPNQPIEAAGNTLLRRLAWVAAAAIAVALASSLALLLCEAAEMTGRSVAAATRREVLATVLWHTQFGRVLLVRVGLTVIAAGGIALTLWAPKRQGCIFGLWIAATAAACCAAASAWAGHAVATPGPWHLLADAAHLVAAGLWLGGLVALAALFAAALRPESRIARASVAAATRRFSVLGLAAVGTLLTTGAVNAWFLVGTLPGLVGTPYGRLLIVKLGLVAAMIALAAVNRVLLTPRLAASQRHDTAAATRWLRRDTLAEAALGLVVLCLVGWLGTLPPGIHEQPWWPFSWRPSAAALLLPQTRGDAVLALHMVALAAGLLVLGSALALRPPSPTAWRRAWLPPLLLGCGLLGWFGPRLALLTEPAFPTTYVASPVAYTTQSIANGQRLFRENCALCHGARGKGDGPAASALPVRPADLTAAHVFAHSEGDLFWWIGNGIAASGMPGFAAQLSESERWDLVNWIETLPIGGLDEGLVTEVGGGSAPRAPDFAFQAADGRESSLRDLLAGGPVLLVLYTPPGSMARLQHLATAEQRLQAAGLQLLALPSDEALAEGVREAAGQLSDFAARADPSVVATYRLIAAPPGYQPPKPPPHLEILIDRDGFARAAWRPDETIAWAETQSLLALVRQLATRPLSPSAALAHQHGP
jgi:putative copper export protein/mono/diheme cytochrome c family protein